MISIDQQKETENGILKEFLWELSQNEPIKKNKKEKFRTLPRKFPIALLKFL